MTFDTGQRLVRIIISLLDQTKLFSLRLVQTTFYTAKIKVKVISTERYIVRFTTNHINCDEERYSRLLHR